MSTAHVPLHFEDEDPWIIEQRIFDLLNEYVQPSSTLSPAATAHALDRLFPSHRSDADQPEGEEREEGGSFLWHLWGRFHQVAQQLPPDSSAQDRLATLVEELRQTTSTTPTIWLESWDSEYRLWQDLPMFGPTLVEESDRMSSSDDEGQQRWRNMNAYIARVTWNGSVNLRWYGIRALAGALEGQIEAAHEHTDRGHVESAFVPGSELDGSVAVAVDWIVISGPALFETNPDLPGGEGGPMWDGKPGLSPERWWFWKQRFGELSEQDNVDEKTRQRAREAQRTMEEIEQRAKAAAT